MLKMDCSGPKGGIRQLSQGVCQSGTQVKYGGDVWVSRRGCILYVVNGLDVGREKEVKGDFKVFHLSN